MPSRRAARGTWEGQVTFQGKRHRRQFATKREAAEWEVAFRKELEREEKQQRKTDTGFVQFCEKYADEIKVRYTEKTYKKKSWLIKRCIKVWGYMETAAITSDHVRHFLVERAETASPSAANEDRKGLSALFEWGRDFMGLVDNPVARVKRFPHTPAPQYTPTRADVLKVLAACDMGERVFLKVYLNTAARRSEIFRWTWADIDFAGRKVRLASRKTSDGSIKYRYLPMSDELFETLQWWWKSRPVKDTPYVFVSTCNRHYGKPFTTRRRFLRGLCKRAGVKEFQFHAIRRHVPSYLLDLGVSLEACRDLLGHESIRTTAVYMKPIRDAISEAVELARTESNLPPSLATRESKNS
jgi:integrase